MPRAARRRDDLVGPAGHADVERVEERVVHDLDATHTEARREQRREAVHALGDRAQPGRAVVRRVQPGDHREQHLGGADVARRLLAADVLLARLQREPVRGTAFRVDRHTDQPAGQRALELVARREVRRVRAAEAERHAEALRGADHHVGAHLPRRHEQREREQVGRDGDERARVVRLLDQRRGGRGPCRSRRDTAAARRSSPTGRSPRRGPARPR